MVRGIIANNVIPCGSPLPSPGVSLQGQLFFLLDGAAGLYVFNNVGWEALSGIQGPAGVQGPAGIPAAFYISASFPGNIGPLDSKSRWSPPRTITLTNVAFNINTVAIAAPVVLDIKKNGVSIFPGAKPTLALSTAKANVAIPNVVITAEDYITLDIIAGDGADLTVRLDYA